MPIALKRRRQSVTNYYGKIGERYPRTDHRKERLETMGKGNRNRQRTQQEAVEDRYNHPEKYQKKGKNASKSKSKSAMPAWANVLAVVLVAVILLGSISLIVVYEKGVILRSKNALKSEHYEITGTMMQYYYYYQYQQTYTQYYEMAVSYLGSADYISYFGWNLKSNFAHDDELNNACKLGTTLKDKDGKEMKDENGNVLYDSVAINLRGGTVYTWWDYFMDSAIKQAKEVLVFCEAAYEDGYTSLNSLNPDAKKDVDDVISELKKTASDAGYSTSGYLTQLYGNGVTVKDVRKALELASIASEYSKLIEEKIENAITSEDVDKKYNDDKYVYHYADALSIAIDLKYDDILEGYVDKLGDDYKDDEYNEAVKKADREYSIRLAHLKEIAPKFAEAKGNEELYRDLVAEIFSYMYYFDAYVEKTDKDLAIEDVVADAIEFLKTMTDETTVKDSDPIEKRIASFVYEEMDLLPFEHMTYDNDALGNWAFKAIDQKVGNVLVVITELDGTEKVYAYPELEYVDVEEDKEESEDDDHDHEDSESEDKDSDDKDDDKDSNKVESEYAGEEYSFSAYYMQKPGARDEYKTLDIGYILTQVENHNHKEGEEVDHDHVDAEAVSKEYLEELLAKDKLTPEIFKQYAKDKKLTSYDVLEDYLRGDFGYDEFDEWVFAEDSRVGTGDVIAIYGDNTTEPAYYVVAYCFAEGEEAWYTAVKDDILSENYKKWESERTETIGKKITMNNSLISGIAD